MLNKNKTCILNAIDSNQSGINNKLLHIKLDIKYSKSKKNPIYNNYYFCFIF